MNGNDLICAIDAVIAELKVIRRRARRLSAPKTVAIGRRHVCTLERLTDFAARGVSPANAARDLGVSIAAIAGAEQRYRIKLPRAPRGAPSILVDPRSARMAELYRAGQTLQEISEQYGITRERVRQILARREGLSGRDGGQHISAQRKRESLAIERESRCLARHGCSLAEWRLIGSRARGIFIMDRRNARAAGLNWTLTLWEWWNFWQESGHWKDKGRGDGYWLRCIDRSRGYALGNLCVTPGTAPGNWREHLPAHPSLGIG